MPSLELYADYDRRDIHDIFDSDSSFIPSRGIWGIRGIIPLPNRAGDYALLVTYGQEQGDHRFDEGISTQGILRWQSQPSQSLHNRQIQNLINHNEDSNAIHLFLRAREKRNSVPTPYTYLGRLKYHSHDRETQEPVLIAWQLQRWPIPDDVLSRMGLRLEQATERPMDGQDRATPFRGTLREEEPPVGRPEGEPTRTFRALRRRYLSDHELAALGLQGELLVVKREQHKLTAAGRADLAALVRHVSVMEGDGAGYDIRSFFPDGRPKFVEVKTTSGPKNSDFWISPTEVAFSAEKAASYELCRVFDYDSVTDSGACYSVFGDLSRSFALTATEYRATLSETPDGTALRHSSA